MAGIYDYTVKDRKGNPVSMVETRDRFSVADCGSIDFNPCDLFDFVRCQEADQTDPAVCVQDYVVLFQPGKAERLQIHLFRLNGIDLIKSAGRQTDFFVKELIFNKAGSGQNPFLKSEYRILAIFIVVLFLLIGFFIGWGTAACLLLGALCSILAGLLSASQCSA